MTSVREKIKYSRSLLFDFFCGGCYSDVVDPLFNSDVSCIWCFQPNWKYFTYSSVKEFESAASVRQVHSHSPIYHPIIKLFRVTTISTIPICSAWGPHFII